MSLDFLKQTPRRRKQGGHVPMSRCGEAAQVRPGSRHHFRLPIFLHRRCLNLAKGQLPGEDFSFSLEFTQDFCRILWQLEWPFYLELWRRWWGSSDVQFQTQISKQEHEKARFMNRKGYIFTKCRVNGMNEKKDQETSSSRQRPPRQFGKTQNVVEEFLPKRGLATKFVGVDFYLQGFTSLKVSDFYNSRC